MAEFEYSLTFDDYVAFEKFKLKKNRTLMLTLIFFIVLLIIEIYNAAVYKDYTTLVLFVALIAADLAVTAYSYYVMPKEKVSKFISLDSSYLGQREIKIDDKKIVLKYKPMKNDAAVLAIYPYSVMNAIFETEGCYYFFVGNEAKLLPKRVIPAELSDYVKKVLSGKKNYIYIK